MVLFRRLLGDVLRRHRQRQSRTLRDVAAAARVSLGYLSEVERGRKEASSELLASVCEALGVSLADVLREVSDDLALLEGRAAIAGRVPVPMSVAAGSRRALTGGTRIAGRPVSPAAVATPAGVATTTTTRPAVAGGVRLPVPTASYTSLACAAPATNRSRHWVVAA